MKLTVKFKKLNENAKMPFRGTTGSAGYDLTATAIGLGPVPDTIVYGTGLAVEIPTGYVGLIFPRSSVYKTGMILTNCVGVIDSDYRGEIKAVFRIGDNPYGIGERIMQMIIMPVPEVEYIEVDNLSETDRGTGGYGSTGK